MLQGNLACPRIRPRFKAVRMDSWKQSSAFFWIPFSSFPLAGPGSAKDPYLSIECWSVEKGRRHILHTYFSLILHTTTEYGALKRARKVTRRRKVTRGTEKKMYRRQLENWINPKTRSVRRDKRETFAAFYRTLTLCNEQRIPLIE